MNNFNSEDPAGNLISSSSSSHLNAGNSSLLQPPQRPSSASSYADLHYLFGAQDPMMNAPKSGRNRRKSTQDHAKHRRTRSGCYTCRSRRVKCDESHPICERCKKGSRECVYPELSTKPTVGSSIKKLQSVSSSDESEDGGLDVIQDEDDEMLGEGTTRPSGPSRTATQRSSISQGVGEAKSATRMSSETPSLVQDKSGASPTPSTEGSVGYSTSQHTARPGQYSLSSTSGSEWKLDWSHLPPDLQFYMIYFYENLTFCHYSLKLDSSGFLRTSFLDAALRNDALLYAVVGFSAFQWTLHTPEGKIENFLPYYNKAVSLLIGSLRTGAGRDIGTLLAILQLATIEEFLGDWINLLGHQKAAYEILTEVFTPQTVMQEQMHRVILGWYMRFDIFAGLMGGFATTLSKEWFSYSQQYCTEQVRRDPHDLDWKIQQALAKHRCIAMDLSLLFAAKGKGEMSDEDFIRESDVMGKRIEGWKTDLDPALQDPRYLVTDFSGAPPPDPNDIVDPYQPNVIYQGRLWVMNVATLDWLAIDLMHKYQTALTLKTEPSKDIGLKAYRICQLFEAMELYPGSPKGAVLAGQAGLGIACLFLPRDETHAMWSRRKFATIECHGYIYPYKFRDTMADIFRDRSCMQWWLPNNECYPPIVRSIREFVEERSSNPKKIPAQQDLKDMKAIFAALNLNDEKSSLEPNFGERKASVIAESLKASHEAHVAQVRGTRANLPSQGDTYALGFDEGRGFWGDQQGGGAFGIPKP